MLRHQINSELTNLILTNFPTLMRPRWWKLRKVATSMPGYV